MQLTAVMETTFHRKLTDRIKSMSAKEDNVFCFWKGRVDGGLPSIHAQLFSPDSQLWAEVHRFILPAVITTCALTEDVAENEDGRDVDEEREDLGHDHEEVPRAHGEADHEQLGEDERRERDGDDVQQLGVEQQERPEHDDAACRMRNTGLQFRKSKTVSSLTKTKMVTTIHRS